MKNIFFSILFVCSSLYTTAQESVYIWRKDGKVDKYQIAGLDSISLVGPSSEEPNPVNPTPDEPQQITMYVRGDNMDMDGPCAYEWKDNMGPNGGGVLCYPKELTSNPNERHPVVIFCPGGGEKPSTQPVLIKRLASMGFIVYSQPSTWDGVDAKKAFDWIEQMNNDPAARFYNKLNMERVGICGHSQGGVMAESCANMDARVATLMLMNSGDFEHDGAIKLTIPTGFITGHTDMAYDNATGDYGNSQNIAPMWLGIKGDEGHGYGPWGGVPTVVAWMRWHLCGEEFRRADFLTNGGAYCNANGWETKFKNW